ncbi:MAG: HEAT repeat domain-containing protein [Luteolibacter sp.]
MNKKRPLFLSVLCLASLVSLSAETEIDAIIPAETKAISTPLDVENLKPGSLTFAENGGVLLSSANQPNGTKMTKILRLYSADEKAEQTIDSPGHISGAFSYEGALFLGGSPEFYIINKNAHRSFAEGFGKSDSSNKHAPISFALGMDGRIYGTFNDSGLSVTDNNGNKSESLNSGVIFRFEPDGTGFEIFHRGLINPSGIAFNEYGDAYTVDAPAGTGDKARLIRIIEEGDSGWDSTYRKQKPAETRWMIEKIWETRNDSQPAFSLPASAHLTNSPSGLAYHPGTGFLENETGRFLICDNTDDLTTSGIISFGIKEKRGGVSLIDPRLIASGIKSSGLTFSTNGNLVATDTLGDAAILSFDPAENTYLADKNTEAASLLSEGFEQRDSTELAALLGHPNSRVRLRAQIALTRKTDALETFKKSLESSDLNTRIHAIHGLGIIARRGSSPSPGDEFTSLPPKGQRESATSLLPPLLSDPNPEIRVQVLRAISEAPIEGDSLPLGGLLADDSDRVRIAAAIAIGKLKALGQYSAVISFIAKNNNRDPYINHAGAYALHHMVQNDRQLSPLLSHESPAVRLAAIVALRRMGSLEVVRFLNDPDPAVQDEVIRAVIDLNMTDAYPMLAALLDSSPREWSPAIRTLLETAKKSAD